MAIDEAIAAVERPEPEQRATIKVRVRTGRIVALNAPVDLTPLETIDLVGFVSTALHEELEKTRPASRIIPVRGPIARA